MLTLILYLYLKKHYFAGRRSRAVLADNLFTKSYPALYAGLMMLLLLLLPKLSESQNTQLNYSIIQGKNHVGWLSIEKKLNGNRTTLTLTSEVKTRIIVPINVYTKEVSTYESGQLIFSSTSRKTNGNTKLNKQTKLEGANYVVCKNGNRQDLAISFIGINLLSLYFQEPVGVTQVYCETPESFSNVIKTGDGSYKVTFKNGDSNNFYYSNGVCSKVKIRHTFFSAEIILKP